MKKIIIATRASKLAIKQAEIGGNLIKEKLGFDYSLLPLTTKGDQILNKSLADIGGKGLFTKEIEDALLEGKADIAIHSMKDVPSEVPEGLEFVAYIDQQDSEDALVTNFSDILQTKKKPRIGTSSLRRKHFAQKLWPHAEIVDLRGNINSRIEKVISGQIDAAILAVAGLKRINVDKSLYQTLSKKNFIPAICQGIIGLETTYTHPLKEQFAQLNEFFASRRAMIERAFLTMMNAGCKVPIAGHAQMLDQVGEVFSFDYFYKNDKRTFEGNITVNFSLLESQISSLVKGIK